jgi:hypothetical protein
VNKLPGFASGKPNARTGAGSTGAKVRGQAGERTTMTTNMKLTTKTTTESASEERKPTVTPISFLAESEWKSSLLRKPELVRSDIFIQGLEPDEVEMIREASERGLKPGGFSVEGNAVILRFERNESRKPLQEE